MERIIFQSKGGRKLCGYLADPTEGPDAPIAIFVHGLGSSKDSRTNQMLETVLLEKGIAVFRFDMFGHGESDGDFADLTHSKVVEDTLAALGHVKSSGYSRIGLVGSSFGGFASVRAAANSDIPQFLALKSPVVTDISRIFGILFQDMLGEWEKQGYIEYISPQGDQKRLNYTFYQDAIRFKGYEFASEIKIPTFIVHGDGDEIVPFDQSAGLVAALPNGNLAAIPDADHRYTKPSDFKYMIKLISDFVMEQFKGP